MATMFADVHVVMPDRPQVIMRDRAVFVAMEDPTAKIRSTLSWQSVAEATAWLNRATEMVRQLEE